MNTLKQLYELGQSPWYDNIDRRLIKDGRLKGFIDNGITGLTSNPSIFEKAVSASDIYNAQIEKLAGAGKSPREIYDEITVSDVRDAADLLKDVYLRTGRTDGYVSIEVYPEYAHDPQRTISYAREVFRKIDRENIMIKVPGTEIGYAAIRTLIGDGINVNVTLLFSVEHYERAAKAYMHGLRDRLERGNPIDNVVSVASVFISRIDSWVDKRLDGARDSALRGKAAVANTRMIYRSFKEMFNDENFGRLKAAGGRIQRPLWASTSTKDPSYSDVKYVEELIGPDTVNTLPQATMEAFLGHGRAVPSIESDVNASLRHIETLRSKGIDIDKICQEIQDEGLLLFQKSFDKLLDGLQMVRVA